MPQLQSGQNASLGGFTKFVLTLPKKNPLGVSFKAQYDQRCMCCVLKAVVSPWSSNSLGPDRWAAWCQKKTAIAVGFSAIVKLSGQNCFRVFMVLWGGSVSGCQKVPPSSKGAPKGSVEVCQLFLTFVSHMAVASKRFFGAFRQRCLTFIFQSPPGVKVV